MGLLNLLSNSIEGLAQTTIGAAKTAVGSVIVCVDEGKTFDSGINNMRDGVEKIGKSD